MTHRLKTIGHATMVIFEDGVPLVATDPWLIGSAYWRSWWLEKYPSDADFEQVRSAKYIYITHSHPDHFHYPTLRKLGKPATLHPHFPRYEIKDFLASSGFPSTEMDPWRWYDLTSDVRIASIPTPIDDSMLIVDTPNAYIANLNDAVPRMTLLRFVRSEMFTDDKPVIMLKSYSPASIAASIYRDGKQTQMKTKRDYTETAMRLATALGASYFVPFASQAFFSRADSKWANDYKVTYEDLKEYWTSSDVRLCEPFADIDLSSLTVASDYHAVDRTLDDAKRQKIVDREQEEKTFVLPADLGEKLRKYMSELYFLRLFFHRGIGWRLTTSGTEYFYDTRTKKVLDKIPEDFDVVINLPDKVISESLDNNVLTDLGITMFIKVETQVNDRFTYGLFLLMGLHDYGHFNSYRHFARFVRYYLPYFFPPLLRLKWFLTTRPSRQAATAI